MVIMPKSIYALLFHCTFLEYHIPCKTNAASTARQTWILTETSAPDLDDGEGAGVVVAGACMLDVEGYSSEVLEGSLETMVLPLLHSYTTKSVRSLDY